MTGLWYFVPAKTTHMQQQLKDFDLFCQEIINSSRISIEDMQFVNNTDKEIFIIKHLVEIMYKLYAGMQMHITDNERIMEMKDIAYTHLQRYKSEIFN